MKIEALEDIKSGGYLLTAGDSITVPDESGAHWCAHGWAKDTAGIVQTGERRVLNATVTVTQAAHGQAAQTIEG